MKNNFISYKINSISAQRDIVPSLNKTTTPSPPFAPIKPPQRDDVTSPLTSSRMTDALIPPDDTPANSTTTLTKGIESEKHENASNPQHRGFLPNPGPGTGDLDDDMGGGPPGSEEDAPNDEQVPIDDQW